MIASYQSTVNHKIRLPTILLLKIIFLLFPQKVLAQVAINEVFPAPTEGSEWVELYNAGTEPVILTNWLLKDQLTTPSTIFSFTIETISPQSYFVIDLPSAKLNNSADGVTLVNQSGEIIDQMSFDRSESNTSWARIPTGTGSYSLTSPTKNLANPNPSPSPSPTPSPSPSPSTSPSPSPSPIPSPSANWWSKIAISELMACPADDQLEWVTLTNSDTQEHILTNWKLVDASNQTRHANLTIPAQGTNTVSWSNSLLNNSGDTITLISDTGTIIDSFSYDSCVSGEVIKKESSAQTSNQKSETEPVSSNSPSPMPPDTFSPSILPLSYHYSPQDILLGSASAQTTQNFSPPIMSFAAASISLLPILSVILGGMLLTTMGGWRLYAQTRTLL